MPKTKPTVLARQLWGRRVAVEVKVDSGDTLRDEIKRVRKALRSQALSELFVAVAKGTNSPSEISGLTGKSKFAVSLQLSDLRKAGLLRDRPGSGLDMRRKRYEVVWERMAEIFKQDHALELEMYENHLMFEAVREIHGTSSKAGLAISGNGKLGLVREIVPDKLPLGQSNHGRVDKRMNRLLQEFIELFKGYLRDRRFATLQEYLLGAYEELSQHYGRFPRSRSWQGSSNSWTGHSPELSLSSSFGGGTLEHARMRPRFSTGGRNRKPSWSSYLRRRAALTLLGAIC